MEAPPGGTGHYSEGQIRYILSTAHTGFYAAKSETVIIQTLYSPFMCAGHTATDAILTDHLNREPEKVKKGLEIIVDSLMLFVRECIKLGVDGFYTSTQGGEAGRFQDRGTFERYIKPTDLALMEEINRDCPFNILHVCDFQRDYDDFSPSGRAFLGTIQAPDSEYYDLEVFMENDYEGPYALRILDADSGKPAEPLWHRAVPPEPTDSPGSDDSSDATDPDLPPPHRNQPPPASDLPFARTPSPWPDEDALDDWLDAWLADDQDPIV